MSGIFNNLVRVASGAGGLGVYHFQTNDTKATVAASHYFDFAVTVLNVGDIVFAAMDLDGTPATTQYMVNTNDGTHVGVIETAFTPFPGIVVRLPDVSNKASDAAVVRLAAPFNGKIVQVDAVLNAALATGNATLTTAINGTGVTTGVITTTQSGSAAGNVNSVTPSALNTFSKGDLITVTGGGSSTATSTSGVSLMLLPT